MNKSLINSEKHALEGNIGKFYLYRILTSMFFAVPIMVLLWQESGLSLTEIMLLQSIFAIATVVLEIPTGYFADIYGRKKALICASICGSIAVFIYGVGQSFTDFLIGELFSALMISLSSGTLSALVFDSLQDLDMEKDYKRVWGRALFFGMISLAISNAIGGFIAEVNLRYTLFATLPFYLLAIFVSASMTEPKRHKLLVKKGYVKELLNIISKSMIQNKKLKWIIVYSGVVFAFNQAALWLYQPYFKLSGLDIVHFGFVFASFQVVAAFSSKYAHVVEEKLGAKYSLAMLIVLVSISYLLMSSFVYLFSFSFCFIQQFVRGFKATVINDYINKLTTSDVRATVLSIESFVGRLVYAVIIPVVGWVADAYTLTQALLVLAITSLLAGVTVLVTFRRSRVV